MKWIVAGLLLGVSLCADVTRLADVRKIFIEKMDNNLDEYLKGEISRKFHGTVTVVLDRSAADAIMSGVNLGAQRTQTATVNLTGSAGKVILWSGTANDQSAKFLDLKHGGGDKVAQHLIGQLEKAMQR